MTKAISDRRLKQGLKALASGLLLALYLIGNTPVEVVHQFSHAHDSVVSHNEEQESDPCHRALYHADQQEGCAHKLHFTKVEKCKQCHVVAHVDQLTFSDPSVEYIFSDFTHGEISISGALSNIVVHLPARAPPVI